MVLIIVFGFSVVVIIGRNINQIKRTIDYNDGINKSEYVMLNGQEQYILTMGHDISNPVIILLHGGPGVPSTWGDYCWLDYMTDDYINSTASKLNVRFHQFVAICLPR